MARQKGLIKLKGTIGDITFYKTKDGHLAKERTSLDGARILSDPAFVRTKENGQEFGSAAGDGKLLRRAVNPNMITAKDNRVTSRLTQLFVKILKLDGTSVRGARNVGVAIVGLPAMALLKGFNFNIRSLLSEVLLKPGMFNYLVYKKISVLLPTKRQRYEKNYRNKLRNMVNSNYSRNNYLCNFY